VAFAEKLVRLARGKDVSFDALIDEYSYMNRSSCHIMYMMMRACRWA